MAVLQFDAGKTYVGRSPGDADHVIRLTVASRTAKTLKTSEGKLLRIFEFGGVEKVRPWGTYSLAPIISADRPERVS